MYVLSIFSLPVTNASRKFRLAIALILLAGSSCGEARSRFIISAKLLFTYGVEAADGLILFPEPTTATLKFDF